MAVIPMSYSPSAIERSFSIVNEFELAGRKLAVIFDENTPRASIINLDPEKIDGSARHRVLAMLELQKKKSIGDNVIAVERFWQDDDCVMQIEGVCVEPALREAGLATILYETLVTKCGVILMSDNEQYEGGKFLWQKIALRAKGLVVFVLDADEGRFYPYDGTKIRYDGQSIPEEKIWSVHPDTSLWGIVLVAEDARRIAELAA